MPEYDYYYGSDGSSVATPTQAQSVAKSDSNWLTSLTSLVNTAIPAAATVYAASKAKAPAPADPSSQEIKAPAPSISAGYASQPAAGSNKNMIFIGAGVLVALVLGFVLIRKK